MPIGAPAPSPLDGNQVLQHAFIDATGELRVAATLVPGGSSEVIISHVDDSIRLGDGTSLVTTTTIGPDVGLDVNIIGGSISVTVNGVSTPAITNISIPAAATEQSHVFPASTIKARVRVRGKGKLQYSYSVGTTGTTYMTLPKGAVLPLDDLDLSGTLTFYFQSDTAGETLEITSWS